MDAKARQRGEEFANMCWLETLIQSYCEGDEATAELAAKELNDALRKREAPPVLNKYQTQILLRLLASKLAPSIVGPSRQELLVVYARPGT